MDFYESMLYNFSEKLRAAVTPSDEEKQSLLAELMQNRACQALEDKIIQKFYTAFPLHPAGEYAILNLFLRLGGANFAETYPHPAGPDAAAQRHGLFRPAL